MSCYSGRLSELLWLAARVCAEHSAQRPSLSAAAGLAGQPLAPHACKAAARSPAGIVYYASGPPLPIVPEAQSSRLALTAPCQVLQHSLVAKGSTWQQARTVHGAARTAHRAAALAAEDVRQQDIRSARSLDVAPDWAATAPASSSVLGSDPDVAAEPRRLLQAALVGAPNAGKSTLTNALVGQKVQCHACCANA